MSGRRRSNDRISTRPALPGAVLHVLLPVVAGAGALLVPVFGWQIAVVGTALLGMLFPQTLGGWLSVACLAIGLLLSEPTIPQVMIAVLVVHLMHVLSALLPLIPWRGGVVVAALAPTLRRLVTVQLVAQPVTLGVLLLRDASATAAGGAVLVGAAALGVLTVVLLRRLSGPPRESERTLGSDVRGHS